MAAAQYIMGLDYGASRIGVALASAIARLPRPLTTLSTTDHVIEDIKQLIVQESVGVLVVGLPRTLNGDFSQQTHDAVAFADRLKAELGLPVVMVDETLTSVNAEAQLAGKKHDKGAIDALAATYILDRYFSEHQAETRI